MATWIRLQSCLRPCRCVGGVWGGGSYPPACPSHWRFLSQNAFPWVPEWPGQDPLSTLQYEIPVSSRTVGLGSDLLWERGEGSRLSRISEAAAPHHRHWLPPFRETWGTLTTLCCQGIAGEHHVLAGIYLCWTFSEHVI